jgi:hypothetical protein
MPGSTTLVIGNESLSIAALNQRKKVANTRNKQYPFFRKWLSMGGKAEGDVIVQPFDTHDHTRPTRLQTGYEQYDDFVQTTLTPGTIGPAFLCQPVFISELDRVKSSGKAKVLDLWKERVENVDMHLARQGQEVNLKGPAASGTYGGHPAWADWRSLNGMDSTIGYLEATATGTNTFWNLSKASFPPATHPLFHNLFANLSGAVGTNGLNELYRIGVELRDRYGEPTPSRFEWYCSLVFAGLLKRTLRTLEQYTEDGDLDDGKRRVVSIEGIKLIPTSDLPQAGTVTSVAATRPSAILVDWDMYEPMFYPGWKFDMTEAVDVPGTVGVQAALFKIGGQNTSQPVGSMAVVTNGEAF